jgi:hypothetical protein
MVHEDYERDYLKELIYLQEQTIELHKEAQELLDDVRLAAKITVIKQEETKQHDGETRSELLPF